MKTAKLLLSWLLLIPFCFLVPIWFFLKVSAYAHGRVAGKLERLLNCIAEWNDEYLIKGGE